MKWFNIISFLIISLCIGSCTLFVEDKEKDEEKKVTTGIAFEKLQISDTFDYEMKQTVEVDARIVLIDYSEETEPETPLQYIKFSVFDKDPADGGVLLASAVSDSAGDIALSFNAPGHLNQIYVSANYIGLPQMYLPIVDGKITYNLKTFGEDTEDEAEPAVDTAIVLRTYMDQYEYLGSYDKWGVPYYLEKKGDKISKDFLDRINASLPEYQPVYAHHPQYLVTEELTSLQITETADICITWIHDGTEFESALGYYEYDTGSRPVTIADIAALKIVYPAASYGATGKGMKPGDKVCIGTIAAGKTLAFFLVADGWNQTRGLVDEGLHILFSDYSLNNIDNPSLKQHNVLIYDTIEQKILLGFEDVKRDNSTFESDSDFNDVLASITVTPLTAVDVSAFPVTSSPDDTDGDGITNFIDDYPQDPLRAFNNYYPGENTFGTLVFEDFWPRKGDYDFNDMVLNYQFTYVTNAEGKVKDVIAEMKIKAVGAAFYNGFGFALDVAKSYVESVEGIKILDYYIEIEDNGVEMGHNDAVIIAFDNIYKVIEKPEESFVNTQPEAPYVDPRTVQVVVTFNEPQTVDKIGLPPYNPFIIINKTRGNEAHLPDYPPTLLMNGELFGTMDDTSDTVNQRYYKTYNNLPWGLDIPADFDYVYEGYQVTRAYLKFQEWAESGGTAYPDWYMDKEGYRNTELIYQAPQ